MVKLKETDYGYVVDISPEEEAELEQDWQDMYGDLADQIC